LGTIADAALAVLVDAPSCMLSSLDLSGTLQRAGGVGGLLATVIHTGTNAGTYFAMYAGNGNVAGYVRAGDGAVVAQYEYGPFGELLRATGPLAREFNFLFSTKYFDWETGLYCYGHRYYNPTTGRWLSRDPIGIRGGPNLYGFVHNDPLMKFDPDGRAAQTVKCAGVCGAVINDWFLDEINAQLQGWDR
jgi:RHS repeat-associated protein